MTMELADSLPSQGRRVKPERILTILWLSGVFFAGFFLLFFLLHRIGLPLFIVHYGFAILFAVGLSIVAWLGRTIASNLFFFAHRSASVSSIGLSGSADWVNGSLLVLLMGLSLSSKYILAPALVLGICFQATLFAMFFRRTGVTTLPGYFEWRYGSQTVGMVSLAVSSAALTLMIIAEFIVARDVIANIASMSPSYAAAFILLLAILPAVVGGWLSLLIVNSALTICILIAILLPSTLSAFLPASIASFPTVLASGGGLAAISYATQTLWEGGTIASMFLAVLALAAGFSVQPQTLSRLALAERPIDAVQTLSFSALIVFLIMAVFPLSFGLIAATPSSENLAAALQNQRVLHLLPYVALLFAAFNALSATLFALSSAIVRGIRRSRKLDPGEQSVFATRLLAAIFCICLYFALGTEDLNPGKLFLAAISICAGGLFVPAVCAVWVSRVPPWASTCGSLAGGVTSAAMVFSESGFSPSTAAQAGICASALVIACGSLAIMLARPDYHDAKLSLVRLPDDAV